MKTFLLSYGISAATTNTLLQHFEKDVSLEHVFLTLCRYYSSWFNIQLLKVIVEGDFGCPDDRRMVIKYEEKVLLRYLDRSIFEIPSKSFAPEQKRGGVEYLCVRLPDDTILKGHDVYCFQHTISNHLGISGGIIQLCDVSNMTLTYKMPQELLVLETSIMEHVTHDPVNRIYNFNDNIWVRKYM